MRPSATPIADPSTAGAPELQGPRRAGLFVLGLAGLLAILALQAARGWRYFPMFMGDQGWYLQVALRVAQGEALYRDVAWAYGPLPVVALAAAFRWLGPDAAWATALNALLAAASLGLTALALRSLLPSAQALGLAAFAALAGPYVGGDLLRFHLYTYTQAASWGAAASLAALVAALAWQRSQRVAWAAVAGTSAGLAFLSKPEFGLIAAGAIVAVLIAGRAAGRAWSAALAAAAAMLALGLGAQAALSGWGPLWRGYTGYDMLAHGRFWGVGLGNKRWLASIACFWLAMAGLAVGWQGRGRRLPALLAAALALAVAGALITPVILAGDQAMRPAAAVGVALGRLLQWLAAVPWAILTPALLAAAVVGRSRPLPPAWWGLWAFALLANLRPLLTGYSSGLALAPGLAVLWWWGFEVPRKGEPFVVTTSVVRRGPEERLKSPLRRRGGEPFVGTTSVVRRGAEGRLKSPLRRGWVVGLLGCLAAINLLGQVLTPAAAFSAPRRWLDTTLGPLAVWDGPAAEEMAALQAELRRRIPAGETIFATGWGAGWYLLADRANPTPFDVVLAGLGTDGPEAADLQATLLAAPPAAILLPVEQWRPAPGPIRRSRDYDAQAVRTGLAAWWETLPRAYVELTPERATDWVVLVKAPER